jgi:hypothetical protein
MNEKEKLLKEHLLSGLSFADEKKVRIPIVTNYQWGSGWTKEDSIKFDNDVLQRLKNAGYIIKDGDISGSSPTLTTKRLSAMDIYLHPMEFTGYAKIEDIEKILDILYDCKANGASIHDIGEVQISDVYKFDDYHYQKILFANSKEILEWMKDNKKENYHMFDLEFDFAQKFRIPRVGDGSALSSTDVDIETIYVFRNIMENLELL